MDQKPLDFYAILKKNFRDVKWIGKSIYVMEADVYVDSPYEKANVIGNNWDQVNKVLALLSLNTETN